MPESRRWTVYEWPHLFVVPVSDERPRQDGVEVMTVAEHDAELQRVCEEYALQRAQLVDALTPCRCPVGFGQVVADDCPRHNPRPRHTISGVSVVR